jgi:hypothetical protein
MLTMAILVAAAPDASDAGTREDAALRLGRTLSADFWTGNTDVLWPQMSSRMHEAIGSPAGLSRLRGEILARYGGPGQLLSEHVEEVQGMQAYVRGFRGSDGGEPLNERWVLQDGHTVAGFFILKAAPEAAAGTKGPSERRAQLGLAALLLVGASLAMYGWSRWLKRPLKQS